MKILILTSLLNILFVVSGFAQNYSQQERRQIINEFKDVIEKTRDRISRMQENGKLSQVQYMDEEKVIQEAEQVLELIREGNYVERSKIEEWKTKLNKLGVDQEKEGEGVQYRDKSYKKDKERGRDYGQSKAYEARMRDSRNRSDQVVNRGNEFIKTSNARISQAKKTLENKRKNGEISENEYQQKLKKISQAEEKIKSLQQNIDDHNRQISEITRDNK